MSVFILDNVLTSAECVDIQTKLDPLCIADDSQYGYFHAPGLAIDSGSIVGEDVCSNIAKSLSNKTIGLIKKFFDKDVRVVNFGYVQMHAGSNNGLHADVSHLDGTPYPDGRHVDYSAIIYLNTVDKDFYGGSISFPNQGLSIKPIAGSGLIFPGDMSHLHSVKTIRSGIRKNVVLFFETV
jgi:hypothetical protein